MEESLRINPPLPNTFERVVPSGGASVCGKFIPGDTVVSVSQLSANLSDKHFQRPNEFLPIRWMGGKEFRVENKNARKPFSYGVRNCPGQMCDFPYYSPCFVVLTHSIISIACAQARVILARLYKDFDISLNAECCDWALRCRVYDSIEKPPLMVRISRRYDLHNRM